MTLRFSRRHLLQAAATAPLTTLSGLDFATQALAQDSPPWRHGVSLFGEVKYPPDFKKFDYVNADAPKGGAVRQISIGTFDSFNLVVAGVKGQVAPAVVYLYESLMTAAQDEVSSEYGLLAESVQYPNDFSWAVYRLRAEARWHDGKPVTPDDVIFSLETLKRLSPRYAGYYRHVVKTERVGERDVKFTFDAPGNRELPQIVGQLTVLPKHWWEGTDSGGTQARHFGDDAGKAARLRPLPIKDFVAGRSVTLERVPDYWGAKLPVRVGQNNFDELRFEFFRDHSCAGSFQGRSGRLVYRAPRQKLGDGLRLPGGQGQARAAGRVCDQRSSGRMQGFAFNICAATSSRTRGCAAHSTMRSISRR
jgi:microcin C transport system substrate-binding protein